MLPSPPPFYRSGPNTLPGARYGFFGRRGGVSEGPYDSLNCGLGSSDKAERVMENRRRTIHALGYAPAQLATVWQNHTARVVNATPAWNDGDQPEADALVTDCPELGLGVLTADCLPVLFSDAGAGVIGAAHAGWRGLFGGILEATLAAMEKKGARCSRIQALVGPCIHQAAYETGDDFYRNAVHIDPESVTFFSSPDTRDRRHFNLPGYAIARLEATGAGKASSLGLCVYEQADYFFSCRRAGHRDEPDYGRQISIIFLDPTP